MTYFEIMAALEREQASKALVDQLGYQVEWRFEQCLRNIDAHSTLINEFGQSMLSALVGVEEHAELATFATQVHATCQQVDDAITVAKAESERTLDALRTLLGGLGDLAPAQVFYHDADGCRSSLEQLTQFATELTALAPASLGQLARVAMSGFVDHARSHLSQLLEGDARNEALQLMEELASQEDGWDALPGLVHAVRTINRQVEGEIASTVRQLDALAALPMYTALLLESERRIFVALKDRLRAKASQGIELAVHADAVSVIRNALSSRFGALSASSGLRQFLVGNGGRYQFEVHGPDRFDQLEAALRSAFALIEPIVEGIANLACQAGSDAQQIIARHLFIGKVACEYKVEVEQQFMHAQRVAAVRGMQGTGASSVTRVAALVGELATLSAAAACLTDGALTIQSRFQALSSPQDGVDIPNVIVTDNGVPCGLRSRAYGGDQVWQFSTAGGREGSDSGRCICISFPVGVVALERFRVSLTPESIVGDWLRWLSGGFLFRQRPTTEIRIPAMPARLADFMRVHVFSQWSGRTPLSVLITALNGQLTNQAASCEAFFSQVVTD